MGKIPVEQEGNQLLTGEWMTPFIGQFFLFATVGAVGTAFHFATLVFLVQLRGADPVSASMAGFAVGALVNYWLNYHVTFRSKCRHHLALPKFLAIALAGLALNTLIMALATGRLHYLLSQACATSLVLLWNFLCNRFWTFRENAIRSGATHASADGG